MRALNVDWSALHSAFQMPMPEIKCFLSLIDGRVLKLSPGDPAMAEARQNREDFVPVDTVPSRIQYQWVDEFTKSVEDETLRKRIEAAINGKGAFRRFKDILLTMPDERRRWFEFRDQKMRQRIVEWVQESGVEALNEPPWEGGVDLSTAVQDNDPIDVDALRDFFIEWFDGSTDLLLQPIELEKLAAEIGKRFRFHAKRSWGATAPPPAEEPPIFDESEEQQPL